jgi:hypothetical protein
MLVCPLVVLEWARRVKPYLGLWALRIALVGYLLLYLSVVWRANEIYIARAFSPHLCRMQRLWQQEVKPATPSRFHKPMVMPIEHKDVVS